ncbi:unnamed protein product [Rhizophagus irregularis]|nr:unnamed protein product [Rhizophagus irregularis]
MFYKRGSGLRFTSFRSGLPFSKVLISKFRQLFTGSVQNPECQNPEWYEIPKYWPALSIMLPGSGFSGF